MASLPGSVGTQSGLTNQDPFQAVFLVTKLAWTYIPPQPPSQALNPVPGLTGGPGAKIMSGRTLPASVCTLGSGQGINRTTLDPFNVDLVGEVRRYSVISFDVTAPDLSLIQVSFGHGPATEMAFTAGSWLEPYKASIAITISGGFRFQVRRTDGWKFPPALTVSRISG